MTYVSQETIGRLVKRYGEQTHPKCRLCGADMHVGEISEGRKIWYCDGDQGRWMGMEPGAAKTAREQHYSASRTVTHGGDGDVINLLNAYLALTKCPTRTAINTLGEASRRLPQDWEIELRFSRDEVSLSLIDPDTGSDVDTYFGDGECAFLEAIEVAIERAAKEGGDA